MFKKISAIIFAAVLAASFTACNSAASGSSAADSTSAVSGSAQASVKESTNVTTTSASEIFTERDMEQEADTSDAESYTLSDGKDITITKAGVYTITGSAKNATIIIDAADDDKVQLELGGITITNDSAPAIYVKNADKVFVTTKSGTTSSLSVTGTFTADGDTNTDAVIFSKDDIVLNGEGTLNISSSNNGISGKDDIKITGGTISIDSAADAVEANESISAAGGNITINSQKDGLHAENDEDNTTGEIYISGGTFTINAASDAIQATTQVQIDGGTLNLTAAEGIEGTSVIINDGTINISASDDGINGAAKSSAYSTKVEINGGNITIVMGQGDTDGIDSNGDLYINGGTINITGQSACDYDGKAEKNGGTLIVNGSEVDTIPNQMMGGGMDNRGGMGGPGGMAGGFGGF